MTCPMSSSACPNHNCLNLTLYALSLDSQLATDLESNVSTHPTRQGRLLDAKKVYFLS